MKPVRFRRPGNARNWEKQQVSHLYLVADDESGDGKKEIFFLRFLGEQGKLDMYLKDPRLRTKLHSDSFRGAEYHIMRRSDDGQPGFNMFVALLYCCLDEISFFSRIRASDFPDVIYIWEIEFRIQFAQKKK